MGLLRLHLNAAVGCQALCQQFWPCPFERFSVNVTVELTMRQRLPCTLKSACSLHEEAVVAQHCRESGQTNRPHTGLALHCSALRTYRAVRLSLCLLTSRLLLRHQFSLLLVLDGNVK